MLRRVEERSQAGYQERAGRHDGQQGENCASESPFPLYCHSEYIFPCFFQIRIRIKPKSMPPR